jgi:hypothetical protein
MSHMQIVYACKRGRGDVLVYRLKAALPIN